MREENIKILKELCFDEYCINDLEKKVNHVRSEKRSDYSMGYYMGYIYSLYDMGHINNDDLDSLASEVEDL